MIEAAENALRDLGFHDVRVRHHEMGKPTPGQANGAGVTHLARIEVAPAEFSKLLGEDVTAKIVEAVKAAGYQHVTLDLQGYRRGSLNEAAKVASK